MFFFLFDDNSKTPDYSNVSEAILSAIKKLMDGVMDNVLYKRPFVPDDFHAEKPLYAALVPDEIWKGSHFERRFSTPFCKAWQSLAVAVGKTYHGQCGQEIKVEDLIGGKGTYQFFISEVNKLGKHYKERIYREYLGIEPPEDFDKDTLQ